MKYLSLKQAVSYLLLVYGSSAFAYQEVSNNVFDACKEQLQKDADNQGNQQCLDYVNGYLQGLIAAKNDAKLERFLSKELVNHEDNYSFEVRSFNTRIGNYADRLHSASIEKACGLNGVERTVHINRIVEDLAYTGHKRTAFIDSINDMIDRGNIC